MITTSGARRRPLALFAAAGALLVLGACSEAEESERDDKGAITEENDKASVFDMKIGDCFDLEADAAGAETETVPAVPCGDPHDLEVFHEVTLEGDDFPGDAEVQRLGDGGCVEAFPTFVGLDYESSVLDFLAYYPTADSWQYGDDRVVTCLVGEPEGKTTGTLKGAAR